jgi:hypothetical protein
MNATTASTKPKQRMQVRSVFYGLWLGALIGGVLVTAIRPVFYEDAPWLDVNAIMRNSTIYVFPFVVVASFTLLRVLVRHNKLHFFGFTSAGIFAGVIVSFLYLLAYRILSWFSEPTMTSAAYVFCSAVVVAWTIWAVGWVAEFIDRKRSRHTK